MSPGAICGANPFSPELLERVLGVRTFEDGVEEPPVVVAVGRPEGRLVARRIAGSVHRPEVEGNADAAAPVHLAEPRDRLCVRQEQVVRRAHGETEIFQPRCMDARAVAEVGGAPWLVVGDPMLHAIPQRLENRGRVLRVVVGGVPVPPSSAILERLRQVPMVEGDEGDDPLHQQLVDEGLVEVQPLGVQLSLAFGKHPRPRDGKTVPPVSHLLDHRHVLGEQPMVIAGHVSGLAGSYRAGRMAEPVPDRLSSSVRGDTAFELVRGSGRSPDEIMRK